MIRSKFVKWMAASAIALAAVPAIGLARHASHVSAAPSLSALTSVAPGVTRAVHHNTVASKSHRHHIRKHAVSHLKHHTRSHKATRSHLKHHKK